jgi:glycosyltransferase involved in cell wall biosynthesis
VTVVTQPNQGAAAARNTALSLSRGDYIQWLDADDILDPDKIRKQMEALPHGASRRTLLSSAWASFMSRPNSAAFVPTPLWEDLSPTEWLRRKLAFNLHMQTATWLVSREVTEAAGPWNTKLLGDDDGEYFCRVLLQSDGVRFVPESRVFYRAAGPTSLSYIGRSSRKVEAQFRSMELHMRYIRSLEDSRDVRAACLQYLQNWLIEFYPERPDIVGRCERLAAELGGALELPRFSWKYAWLGAIGGPRVAKRAQIASRRVRWSIAMRLDRLLSRIDGFRALSVSQGQ